MKSGLMMTAAIALLLVAGMATAKEARDVRPYAHETMQDTASASAQSSSDMSYGGVRDTRSASGGAHTRTCSTGPQCDIFFGQ